MKNKLFPYTDEEKWTIMKKLKYTEDNMKEDIAAIIDWFEKQPHLVEAGIDPDEVRTFLIMSKGSRENVKRRIDKFYKYRGLAPELIQNRKGALSSSQDIWTCFRQAAILKLNEGRRVTVIQLHPDPSSFSSEEFFTNLYMIYDLRLRYDCFLGEIWVIDLKNVTLGHLLRLNPMMVQRAVQIFQDGSGFIIHAIHVLNFPSIGHQIITLFRKFVKGKIMERVMIHSSLEELYKVLPKRYLPKDYGGEDYTMQEYKDMYEKELRSEPTKQFLLDACKHVSDETKQPAADINEEYLTGTFKKLSFD